MIPLKVDATPNRFPFVTILLIGLCVTAHFMRHRFSVYGSGFIPVDFTHALLHPGPDSAKALLSLLLSFFLHAGLLHLLSNMWYLWIFGTAMEYAGGSLAYTLVYLACGVLSMVVQAVSAPLSNVPIVGASGAIAGVMGACLVLLPLSRVVMWFPPIFFVRVPAVIFLLLWFILQYVSMRNADPEGSNIAWWAHIGGFACGFIVALELRRRGYPARARPRRPTRVHVAKVER